MAKPKMEMFYTARDNCAGKVLVGTPRGRGSEDWHAFAFACQPDGRTAFADKQVPAAVREFAADHCNTNCRSLRWRHSPYHRGGRVLGGCGCMRGRKR